MSAPGKDYEHEGGKGKRPFLQRKEVEQGGGEQPGGHFMGQVRKDAAPGNTGQEKEAVSSAHSKQGGIRISPGVGMKNYFQSF